MGFFTPHPEDQFASWFLVSLLLASSSVTEAAPADPIAEVVQQPPSAAAPAAGESAPGFPTQLILQPGELRSVTVGGGVTRIALGNPEIIDLSMISPTEVLLKAKASGTTNLILWDAQGQHVANVEVADQTVETHVTRLLEQLNLTTVQLKRENRKLFLIGQVDRQDDFNRIGQILSAYGDQVVNLVTLIPAPPPPPAPPTPPGKSIALTVQLVEMSRSATDEFGVDLVSSINAMTFTETLFDQRGPSGGLYEGLSSLSEAFRLGSFDRTALEAKLRLLASQGKVRILAEPKLVAGSGKQARALLGVQVPVVTGTSVSNGVVTQAVEFRNTGVEMSFEPTILEDGHSIQLKVSSKVSSVDESVARPIGGTNVPGFRIRENQTEVVTAAGKTLMIAGLLQEEERKSLSQVPALGSMPVIGNLFRSTNFVRGQTELVIVVGLDILGDAEKTAERSFALEQALASAEVAGAVEDPTLRYVLTVQDRVAKAIRYPAREKEQGLGGQVKLRLHLFRDGTLGRAAVSESSGIEALDVAAIKAAESQAPYPAFSSELVQQDLWLELPVIFRP